MPDQSELFSVGEEIKLPSVSLKGSYEGCSSDGHIRLLGFIPVVSVVPQMDGRVLSLSKALSG